METTKKYELTSETIKFNDITLHRIKALKDFSYVKAGDLGGWVEKEDNLSQMGNAWVYDNAKVYDNAIVSDNAIIYDNAKVYGRAKVYDNAVVCSDIKIFGNSRVCGDSYL